MTTIILHIGRHKTGTSSIQATLTANRDLLATQGVLYPSSLPENHSGFFRDAFYPAPEALPVNKHEGRTRNTILNSVQRRIEKLATEFEEFEGSCLALSGEDACTLPPEGVRNIKKKLDDCFAPQKYQIFFYTRHPISFALSGIQQNVKGNGLTLEDAKDFHLRGGGKRYAEIITNYSNVFGVDCLNVRSFENAMHSEGSIVTDFCKAACIDFNDITEIRKNDSIAAEIVYFLSWLYEGPRRSDGPIAHHRSTRIPLSEGDRSLLFGLKGANADFLCGDEIDALWAEVEEDMIFLESNYGIAYRRPAKALDAEKALFSEVFLNQLHAAMPLLSLPLKTELARFLDLKSV